MDASQRIIDWLKSEIAVLNKQILDLEYEAKERGLHKRSPLDGTCGTYIRMAEIKQNKAIYERTLQQVENSFNNPHVIT